MLATRTSISNTLDDRRSRIGDSTKTNAFYSKDDSLAICRAVLDKLTRKLPRIEADLAYQNSSQETPGISENYRQLKVVFQFLVGASATSWEEKAEQDEIAHIEQQLRALEQNANLSSDEFYRLWEQGDISDTFEHNAWAMLVEARNTLQTRRQ